MLYVAAFYHDAQLVFKSPLNCCQYIMYELINFTPSMDK